MELILTFKTTHDAIAAEQALLAAGLPVMVMNLPAAIRAGCGIALRLPAGHLLKAQQVLATKGIGAGGVYESEESPQNGQAAYRPMAAATTEEHK